MRARRSQSHLARQTISDFGDQWQRYTDNEGYYGDVGVLEGTLRPLLKLDDLRGKRIAEIGSGTGRIVSMLLQAGAKEVTAIEPSAAFEVLKRNLVQHADRVVFLNKAGHEIPTDGQYDFVVSIGVIHHIPDPRPVIAASLRALAPGGRIIVWLYGKEGSGLIVSGIRALRALTTRLPHFFVAAIAHFLLLALDVYIVACRLLPGLPLGDYIRNVLGRFSRSKRYLVVYDQLRPAYAKYYSEAEARGLLESNGFADVQLHFRHGYSWTVVGTRRDKSLERGLESHPAQVA
ncbi:SAM-dependent methyltransferase [Bradyrhizobium sp. AZCC 1678]|uniref:class I SAM-dependent methyltransferase n=1 Tax=Bradyrhizobium sp. AZCC 1678 TaxID=3117030 RepID=UPI002FF01F5E